MPGVIWATLAAVGKPPSNASIPRSLATFRPDVIALSKVLCGTDANQAAMSCKTPDDGCLSCVGTGVMREKE